MNNIAAEKSNFMRVPIALNQNNVLTKMRTYADCDILVTYDISGNISQPMFYRTPQE